MSVTVGKIYVSFNFNNDPFISEPAAVIVEEIKENSNRKTWVRYRFVTKKNGECVRGILDNTAEVGQFERMYRPYESKTEDAPKEESTLRRIVKNAIGLLEV